MPNIIDSIVNVTRLLNDMSKIDVAIAATVMLLLILPFCASGEATIPYIDIVAPKDGETVMDKTELLVVAEGHELRDPYVYISGDNTSEAFPLKGCVYYSPIQEEVNEELNESVPNYYPRTRMKCRTTLDLSSFSGKKVRLTVSVSENGEKLMDSVGLYVSGQCAIG